MAGRYKQQLLSVRHYARLADNSNEKGGDGLM